MSMMGIETLKLSRTLETVCKPLANWTVQQHAAADPSLAPRYGRGWQTDWTQNVEARLAYLAQAVALDFPPLFSASVRWNQEAIQARGETAADLEQSIRHMKTVLEEELPNPLAHAAGICVDEALKVLEAPEGQESELPRPSPHAELTHRYIELLISGEHEQAISLIMDRAHAGTPVVELYVHVLQPAQAGIGRLWHQGEISISVEHRATATTQRLMSQLRPLQKTVPARNLRLVAASIGGDFHEIGIRMVAECFEFDGWQVTYLGSNLPVAEAAQATAEIRADLLAISASTFLHLRDTAELIHAIRSEPTTVGVKVMVGGPPFNMLPSLWQVVGADGFAINAMEAVRVGTRLAGH